LLVHEYYNKDDCCVRVRDAVKPATTIQLIIITESESEMPPSQLPPSLRVEIVQGRNVFPSIICEECDRFPTQHRCLVEVTTGGYLFDGLVVCGAAVCAICSTKCGQEGTFRCGLHAATTFVTEKENWPPDPCQNTRSSTWPRKGQVMVDATNAAKADDEKKKAAKADD
jgi:hypothetical protein